MIAERLLHDIEETASAQAVKAVGIVLGWYGSDRCRRHRSAQELEDVQADRGFLALKSSHLVQRREM